MPGLHSQAPLRALHLANVMPSHQAASRPVGFVGLMEADLRQMKLQVQESQNHVKGSMHSSMDRPSMWQQLHFVGHSLRQLCLLGRSARLPLSHKAVRLCKQPADRPCLLFEGLRCGLRPSRLAASQLPDDSW